MPVLLGCLLVGLAVGLVLPASASREAQLTVRVTDNRTYVAPSATVNYTVTVLNEGGETADAIAAQLELGAGLTVVSASDGGKAGGAAANWPAFSLAGGAQRVFRVVARVPDQPAPGTRYESKANATAQGTIAEATDESFVGAAQLAVTKTDGAQEAVRGDTLTYTITVSNPGTLPLGGVNLVDKSGSGLVFESASRGGVWNEAHRQVTWPGFELAAGAHEVFTVTAKVPEDAKSGQVLRNSASVTAPGLSDQALDETLVTVATGLALSKSDDRDTAKPGEDLTYTITVRNTGEVDHASVSLVDRFGDRLKFVSLNPSEGSYADREVRWPDFPLKAGERRVFSVVARVLATGETDLIRNEVIATTSNGRLARAEDTTVLLLPPPPRIAVPPSPRPSPSPSPTPTPKVAVDVAKDETRTPIVPTPEPPRQDKCPHTQVIREVRIERPVTCELHGGNNKNIVNNPGFRDHDHGHPGDFGGHPGRHFDHGNPGHPGHHGHPGDFGGDCPGDCCPDDCCGDTCPGGGPTLPSTGVVMVPVVGAGALLFTLGSGILVITRRRRRGI
ncbi:hypothetical protein Aph01nite_78530 [Acrocarpospora phusangensis]|uniref:DUF11 domain-containing protein n=1 Tax=Acrocarpospora phusangensis TaxID=1070424 RepID=A0A919QIR5_9ACTN|nr:DUF11 domain-containing protein [Acrocarpospora phusangensis]GIH29543.1 hypothetical protein Aph01nite_78530 [Acrocarpospora phusangensis]